VTSILLMRFGIAMWLVSCNADAVTPTCPVGELPPASSHELLHAHWQTETPQLLIFLLLADR